jgi:hypothetical protein
VSNDQKFKDIVLLTECAKIMQTLAETRHAEASSIRMGKGLLDIAARMKAEIEESIKNKKKVCRVGYGVDKELTKQEFVDGAVERFSQEMTCSVDILSERAKHEIRAKAAAWWDEAK